MSGITRLQLKSTSRSDDAGHLAAWDLADIGKRLGVEYRLIGGLSVTLLTWAHGVTHLVPIRETADADFGASASVIGDPQLANILTERGYQRVAGNRFTRTIQRDSFSLDLAIDILAPSYKGRLVSNVQVGQLSVDEIPALSLALAMDPTIVNASVLLTDERTLDVDYRLPHVVAALCMKAYAFRHRRFDRDAVDIWRLLEAAYASGVRAADWNPAEHGFRRDASYFLYEDFGEPTTPGPRVATANTQRQARIRTLLRAVVARPPSAC